MQQKKYNVDRIKAFVGDDQEMLNKIVKIFLDKTPSMLANIKNCIAEKDFQTVQFVAHKLKTSIDHFSIETITTEIRQIEKYAKEEINLQLLPLLFEKLDLELQETMAEIKADFNIS
jgi:HPt (histidine-containing phosphotransfer) domain-containing protein